MKKIQFIFCLLAFALMGFSSGLRADDIDIYVSNSSNIGTPNVLFVIDNGADFSANAATGCSQYYDSSGAPNAGTNNTAGVLQCALYSALSGLANGVVNIGVMVSNANGFANAQATTDTTKGGFHESCTASGDGGCLLRKMTLMDSSASGKPSMLKFIKSWRVSNAGGISNDADNFIIKVNSSVQATTMQEAWAYFNGRTGMSGKTYSPSLLAAGCQRNFIVYISNTQKSPSTSEAGGASAALTAAGGSTSNPITGSIKFGYTICPSTPSQATSAYTLTSGNNWADEWARYMYQTDGGATGNEGIQNVVTYSIGIQSSDSQCRADTYGLIASMAKNGGGKFFNTSSVDDLTTALSAILNEVQAVNSVFSSASLPVSVNAEGTYLNQIYLGMFRPDATASPRWLGNLKQYKLAKDSTGSLVLVDKDGQSAISASGTGFLSPTAVSFWTSKTTTAAPDNVSVGGYSGMFAASPTGTPLSGYDSPDGEVVEKGGAAQQLRKENLAATFVGSSNTASTNPRRLYTYCPAGSSCNTDLTHSSNDFSTANGSISSGAFGAASTLKITNVTRSGLLVTATTNGNHGLSAGTVVTISGVSPTQYNGTNITLISASGSTLTYNITAEYPNLSSQGTYSVTKSAAGAAISLTGASLSGTTVTVTSASSLAGFGTGQVKIDGFTQSEYNGTFTVTQNLGNSLQYTITLRPPTPAVNTYKASYTSPVSRSISGITTTGSGVNRIATITTTSSHNFHAGQTVTFSGTTKTVYDGVSWPIATIVSATQFTVATGNTGTTASTGTVTNSQTAQLPLTIARSGTTATVSGLPNNWFTTGDTVDVAKNTGTASDESAYEKTGVVIACSGNCNSFTYTVATSPATPATGSGFATVPGSTGSIAIGGITRTLGATTAQVIQTISAGGTFATGDSISIATTGSSVDTESAYVGNFTIACTAPCSTFTISGIALTPTTTGSGSNMSVYSATTPPDRDTIIKWLRGSDNFGDELSPGGTVTVRPSVHADVLHSRPLVINYGDSRGIVVYYGTNDGVFHAVNGNQTASIGSVAAGGELWGMVLTEHYSNINRQRIATPELKFPSTTVMTASTKDYFIDGPTGSFQQINPDGTVDKAYIYLTMRRGGRYVYALDVTTPSVPKFLWKISSETAGFADLGQTWSRPVTTLVQSSPLQQTPLVVFGAGYDSSEDSEPPGVDSMGRGLYIVNATTGALVWSASPTCTTSATCLNVPGMTHAIASDVTFVDRDFDGYQDKIYVADLGGNLWRADVADASTSNWKMTKVAALGCDTGACAAGVALRKFFFPPGVLTVKVAGATGSYDVLVLVSGDREHPLKNTASGSSYNVSDKIFVIKDETTTVNPSTFLTSNLEVSTGLFNSTSTKWDGSLKGFYITLATGEKGVNAPNPVNGNFFFATNQPSDPSSTCAANLGTARAYALSPFTSNISVATLSGGGLPPSSVAGLVELETVNPDGSVTVTEEKFCIGCGVPAPPGPNNPAGSCTGNSALQNCTPPSKVTGAVKRTYWYKK